MAVSVKDGIPYPLLKLTCEIWNEIFNVYPEYRVLYRFVCKEWGYWIKNLPQAPRGYKWSMFIDVKRNIVDSAAFSGELSVLKWITSSHYHLGNQLIFYAAAYGGHPEVLDWVLEKFGPPWNWYRVEIYASRGGHVSVLRWMRFKSGIEKSMISSYGAVANGHIEALEYLIGWKGWDPGLAHTAVLNNQFRLMNWILEKGYFVNWEIMRIECENRKNEVALKWISDQSSASFGEVRVGYRTSSAF